jgi:RNA polymerase sigma-70 factor (ECF subfamily)
VRRAIVSGVHLGVNGGETQSPGGGSPSGTEKSGGGDAPLRSPPELQSSVIEGVRRRDPEAQGAFFGQYFDCVYGLAYRLLGNRTSAEDATQDVFYKVYRAAHRLDPQRDPVPWLVTITLNTCRSLWRSASHKMEKRSVDLESSASRGWEPTSSSKDPEEALIAAERERQVQKAVTELPESLREVVILRDFTGLGHKEIADMLGVSHEAVRKRYSRALSELGAVLKGMVE